MAKRRYIVIQNRGHMTYSMLDTTTNNSLISGFAHRWEAQAKADEYEKWNHEKLAAPVLHDGTTIDKAFELVEEAEKRSQQ